MITIQRTDGSNPDFRDLVVLLDRDLQTRDGDEHSFYAQFNKVDNIHYVILAFAENNAIGCGAIKEYAEGVAEIKRMFVLPPYRGQGIAKRVVVELESWARELGYSSCILETGKKQPEAIRLYINSGYMQIPNYGQYENDENSVCMQKML